MSKWDTPIETYLKILGCMIVGLVLCFVWIPLGVSLVIGSAIVMIICGLPIDDDWGGGY